MNTKSMPTANQTRSYTILAKTADACQKVQDLVEALDGKLPDTCPSFKPLPFVVVIAAETAATFEKLVKTHLVNVVRDDEVVIQKPVKTAKVTIISIWSKDPTDSTRQNNVTYTVEVPQSKSCLEILESAFILTNQDNRPMAKKACSTSSGDVMQLCGVSWLVEGSGYHHLAACELDKILKLTSRDTSFGYEFLRKNNLI